MATMRLRCIHSFMVVTVIGLLLVYSAFLTSPAYLDDGETSGSTNSIDPQHLLQQQLLSASANSKNAVTNSNAIGALTDTLLDVSAKPNQPQPLIPPSSAVAASASASSSVYVPPGAMNNDAKRDVSKQEPLISTQDLADSTLIQVREPFDGQSKKLVTTASNNNNNNNKQTQLQSQGTNGKRAVTTRDIYESGFSTSNPTMCPNDGQDVKLFIMIMSAPGHFSARDAIRLTWGHYAQRMDISLAFLIGRTENETILDGIELEKHLYDDLIVANFEDSYDNLTLKTMSTLEWVDTYCNQSDFVLKTDDDMFINVPNLLTFIDRIEEDDKKQSKIYGRLAKKWKPVRNKKSKYYISFQQYRKTVYPDFTTGPAYLFSARIARSLFEKGMEMTYLKLEDVYTTGIVAHDLGIKRMNIGDFANKKVNFHKTGFCALSKLISMHMVAFHEQFELWKKILDGRTKCKIIYNNSRTNSNSISSGKSSSSSSSSGGGGSNFNSNTNTVPIATIKSPK